MSKNKLSMLIAAALFGAGTAVAQSTAPSEPVDPMHDSMQHEGMGHEGMDHEGMTENGVPVDERSVQAETVELGFEDESDEAVAEVDAEVDADLDPELDADADAMADADLDVDGTVDADLDADTTATMDAQAGTEMDAAAGASTAVAAEEVDAGDIESGEPKDAFASTAGTEGFSEGKTAAKAERVFSKLDADSSGALSSEEVGSEHSLAASFEEYDINDDGSIAENEFQSWLAATAEAGEETSTAMTGDGELGQDATAASTEPETDTVAGAETDDGVLDSTAATDAAAATDASVETGTAMESDVDATAETDATAQTDAEVATDAEATAQTDYDDVGAAFGEEDEEDLVQSDEDE